MDYSNEPARPPQLKVLAREPFNAEPDISKLIEHNITPEDLAYVRNHGAYCVRWRDQRYQLSGNIAIQQLTLDGFVKSPRSFTLDQLEREFKKVGVIATMQCAGNRRQTMNSMKQVKGIQWGDGSLMNAKWTGYRLSDIIEAVGISDEHKDKPLHACFASEAAPTLDEPWYGASIPIDVTRCPERNVLLATHMNGKVLSADHGFPLRMIVPGHPGVRWVKWLQRITISDKESPNFYQQKDYKILPSYSTKASPPSILVKGYALGDIKDVEVSLDEGATIHKATLTYREGPWSWTTWVCEVDICGEEREMNVVVWSRAISKCGKKQPDKVEWNIRGIAYNGLGKWEGKVCL